MADNEPTFEASFAELEQVVARLQEGNLPLEDSLALFERGMQLAQRCGAQLEQAELRVRQLLDNGATADMSIGGEDNNE